MACTLVNRGNMRALIPLGDVPPLHLPGQIWVFSKLQSFDILLWLNLDAPWTPTHPPGTWHCTSLQEPVGGGVGTVQVTGR